MPYIRGTDLKNGTINTDDLAYISPEDQIEIKKAKEGDVVVTRVGTIGLSARIPKECEGGTISDNLIRLRFDQQKLSSYYLALFLGSLLGVNLMIKNSRGSVQQRLNQETLKEVIIPLLPLSTQQKIASLVQQSHEARKKAKELLEVAKKAVEIAIEKSEKEALEYISKTKER
jgi:restriction endonuclease S subunit